MPIKHLYLSLLLLSTIIACDEGGGGGDVVIPDFNLPSTVQFQDSLSFYNVFEGNPIDLIPNDSYHLLELSSPLFTDYAHKQRLVKVPDNTQMVRLANDEIDFPDNTILAKTFYYFNDERDEGLGKRVMETRLMIKAEGLWNVATYIWNNEQTEAILELNGLETPVNWVDVNGINRSTVYDFPDENECITCHQADNNIIPLGTTLPHMNRNVTRSGQTTNLLSHLQVVGVLNDFNVRGISEIPDYHDSSYSPEERARAYMHINCSHCHNPAGWEEAVEQDLDFRYSTPLNQTGILMESDEIVELVQDGEMPFIGTTMLDESGVPLIVDYINSL